MTDPHEKTLTAPIACEDMVLPFQLQSSPVRGRLVRLGSSIDTILRQHDYPVAVCRLVGQAAAMAAALGTALKFDGVFTLQTKTDGPVRMMVVDVTSAGAVRACAQFDGADVASAPEAALLGQGHLVFTVDQTASDERYQGIVKLEGDSLTQAFQLYFKQSEQIPTGLMAAARQDETGAWHAACLMVQRMPTEGGNAQELPADDTAIEDDWHRTMTLMQTCTEGELTDPTLPPETLLYRLFHEEGVRAFEAMALRHECRCSRDKIEGVLSGLPEAEMKAMVQADGKIAVTCQFCSQTYLFTPDQF